MDMAPPAVATISSDMQCAAHLLRAAVQCAAENVRINLGSMKDAEAVRQIESRLAEAMSGT